MNKINTGGSHSEKFLTTWSDPGKVRRLTVDIGSNRTCFIVVIALMLGVCLAVPAFSSVLAVSIEQLSQSSQLIFEGEVIGMTSNFNANRTSIHTTVTFRVVDVIKGAYSQTEIALRFMGGTVGGIRLNVSDSTLPEIGEAGIYFVESLERFQVNPLYGSDQGHFLIVGAGRQRIMAARNGRIVAGLPAVDQPRAAGLSDGVARGLSLNEAGGATAGVTVFEFKQAIRQY